MPTSTDATPCRTPALHAAGRCACVCWTWTDTANAETAETVRRMMSTDHAKPTKTIQDARQTVQYIEPPDCELVDQLAAAMNADHRPMKWTFDDVIAAAIGRGLQALSASYLAAADCDICQTTAGCHCNDGNR